MTYVLDEKDRKIIAELDLDSRQSDSEIAKKVGLSKQVTNYRIQRLIENEIIFNFYTALNVGQLGFNGYYVFLQLQKISKKKETELIDFLKLDENIGWVVSGTGKWDLVILIYAQSESDFSSYLNDILLRYEQFILEYEYSTLIEAEHKSYEAISKEGHLSIKQTEKQEKITLSELDVKILKMISENGRMNVVDVANNLNEKTHVISYHLKRLIKTNVIEGFKPRLDVSLLGIQWYLLLIKLQPISEERKLDFLKFCRADSRIYYLTNTSGTYNLMLDIHVQDAREFKEVLFEIKEKFADCIKFYETNVIFDEFKISYVPKLKF